MKNNFTISALLLLTVLIGGCSKSSDNNQPTPAQDKFVYTQPTLNTQADINALLIRDYNIVSGLFPDATYKYTLGAQSVVAPYKTAPFWTTASTQNLIIIDRAIQEYSWNRANGKTTLPDSWTTNVVNVTDPSQARASLIYWKHIIDNGTKEDFRFFAYEGTYNGVSLGFSAAVDRITTDNAGNQKGWEFATLTK